MKKIILIVLMAVISLSLISCVEDVTTEQTQGKVETLKPTATPIPNDGTLGDYKVVIKSARLGKDYDDKDAVIITYEWTNNSDKSTSFMIALIGKVFQNGVECDNAIIMDDINSEAYMKDIKPGVSLEVEQGYLISDKSQIEVEVKELISLSDNKVIKKFDLE